MIHISKKTPIAPKIATLSATFTSYAVRGVWQKEPWSPAGLLFFTVHFYDAKGRHGTLPLAPAIVKPTPAEFAAIVAVPPLAGDSAGQWLERASASFVQKAYGLSLAPISVPR